jgi:hypothetical protein
MVDRDATLQLVTILDSHRARRVGPATQPNPYLFFISISFASAPHNLPPEMEYTLTNRVSKPHNLKSPRGGVLCFLVYLLPA